MKTQELLNVVGARLQDYKDYSIYVEAKINIDEMPLCFNDWQYVNEQLRED